MLGKLIPCGGGPPIALGKTSVVIGRNRDCDITIACASVSGRHCELQLRDGAWWVRDLGSRNGTAVNGTKSEEQRVGPEDVLAVGRQRYVLSHQPATAQPRPPAADEDVDALAMALLTADEEPVAPAPALGASLPTPPMRAHGPQVSTPHLPTRANLGQLVPCGGGETIPLIRPEMTLGRSPSCDICLRFASVSGKHCKLSLQQGYWFVRDLNSSNGTWVDGVRCQSKCLLPASVLGVAKHRFTLHYTATGPPPEEETAADVFSQSLLEKAGLAKLMKDGPLPADDDESQSRRIRLDLDDK